MIDKFNTVLLILPIFTLDKFRWQCIWRFVRFGQSLSSFDKTSTLVKSWWWKKICLHKQLFLLVQNIAPLSLGQINTVCLLVTCKMYQCSLFWLNKVWKQYGFCSLQFSLDHLNLIVTCEINYVIIWQGSFEVNPSIVISSFLAGILLNRPFP